MTKSKFTLNSDFFISKQYFIIDNIDDVSNFIFAIRRLYHFYKFFANIKDLVVLRINEEESNNSLKRTIQARCR